MAGHHYRCNEHELGQLQEMVMDRGVLQSIRLQRVRHDWATKQQQHFHFYCPTNEYQTSIKTCETNKLTTTTNQETTQYHNRKH